MFRAQELIKSNTFLVHVTFLMICENFRKIRCTHKYIKNVDFFNYLLNHNSETEQNVKKKQPRPTTFDVFLRPVPTTDKLSKILI